MKLLSLAIARSHGGFDISVFDLCAEWCYIFPKKVVDGKHGEGESLQHIISPKSS